MVKTTKILETQKDKIEIFKKIDQTIIGKKPFIVLVLLKGCGHCERLEPVWNKALSKSSDVDLDIIHMDAPTFRMFEDMFPESHLVKILQSSFQGYPHIIAASKKGRSNEYNVDDFEGERTVDDLMVYIQTTAASADTKKEKRSDAENNSKKKQRRK